MAPSFRGSRIDLQLPSVISVCSILNGLNKDMVAASFCRSRGRELKKKVMVYPALQPKTRATAAVVLVSPTEEQAAFGVEGADLTSRRWASAKDVLCCVCASAESAQRNGAFLRKSTRSPCR